MSDETEITHEPTRRLFSKNLARVDGKYFVRVGPESKEIEIEDTPSFVIRIEEAPEGVALRLIDGTLEMLDPKTLSYQPGRLTCRVKDGAWEAKFLRAPYHEILARAEERDDGYFLRVGGREVRLADRA